MDPCLAGAYPSPAAERNQAVHTLSILSSLGEAAAHQLLQNGKHKAKLLLSGRVTKPSVQNGGPSTMAWESSFARRHRIRIVPPGTLANPIASQRRQPRPGLASVLQQTVDTSSLPEDYLDYFAHTGSASEPCGCAFCAAQQTASRAPSPDVQVPSLQHPLALAEAAMSDYTGTGSDVLLRAVDLDPAVMAAAQRAAALPPLLPFTGPSAAGMNASKANVQAQQAYEQQSTFQTVDPLQSQQVTQPKTSQLQPEEQQQQQPEEQQEEEYIAPLFNIMGGQYAAGGDQGDGLGDVEGDGDEWEDMDGGGGGMEEEEF